MRITEKNGITTMLVTAQIDIEFRCECGSKLSVGFAKKFDNGIPDEIIVKPCKKCLEDEFDRGYQEGEP